MAKLSFILKNVFTAKADRCERLVGLLQWISFNVALADTGAIVLTPDILLMELEKGCLYFGMMNYGDVSLLDQILLTTDKFSELNQFLEVAPYQMKLERTSCSELLEAVQCIIGTLANVATRFPITLNVVLSFCGHLLAIAVNKFGVLASSDDAHSMTILGLYESGDVQWHQSCSVYDIFDILHSILQAAFPHEREIDIIMEEEQLKVYDIDVAFILPTDFVPLHDDPAVNSETYSTIYSSLDSVIQMIRQDEAEKRILHLRQLLWNAVHGTPIVDHTFDGFAGLQDSNPVHELETDLVNQCDVTAVIEHLEDDHLTQNIDIPPAALNRNSFLDQSANHDSDDENYAAIDDFVLQLANTSDQLHLHQGLPFSSEDALLGVCYDAGTNVNANTELQHEDDVIAIQKVGHSVNLGNEAFSHFSTDLLRDSINRDPFFTTGNNTVTTQMHDAATSTHEDLVDSNRHQDSAHLLKQCNDDIQSGTENLIINADLLAIETPAGDMQKSLQSSPTLAKQGSQRSPSPLPSPPHAIKPSKKSPRNPFKQQLTALDSSGNAPNDMESNAAKHQSSDSALVDTHQSSEAETLSDNPDIEARVNEALEKINAFIHEEACDAGQDQVAATDIQGHRDTAEVVSVPEIIQLSYSPLLPVELVSSVDGAATIMSQDWEQARALATDKFYALLAQAQSLANNVDQSLLHLEDSDLLADSSAGVLPSPQHIVDGFNNEIPQSPVDAAEHTDDIIVRQVGPSIQIEQRNEDDLRTSVVVEVMRSIDDEDLVMYSQRVYEVIKTRTLAAVGTSFNNLSESDSDGQSDESESSNNVQSSINSAILREEANQQISTDVQNDLFDINETNNQAVVPVSDVSVRGTDDSNVDQYYLGNFAEVHNDDKPLGNSMSRDERLRQSVMSEVLKSVDGEDLASYGLRAYQAIKNSALANMEWGSMSVSVSASERAPLAGPGQLMDVLSEGSAEESEDFDGNGVVFDNGSEHEEGSGDEMIDEGSSAGEGTSIALDVEEVSTDSTPGELGKNWEDSTEVAITVIEHQSNHTEVLLAVTEVEAKSFEAEEADHSDPETDNLPEPMNGKISDVHDLKAINDSSWQYADSAIEAARSSMEHFTRLSIQLESHPDTSFPAHIQTPVGAISRQELNRILSEKFREIEEDRYVKLAVKAKTRQQIGLKVLENFNKIRGLPTPPNHNAFLKSPHSSHSAAPRVPSPPVEARRHVRSPKLVQNGSMIASDLRNTEVGSPQRWEALDVLDKAATAGAKVTFARKEPILIVIDSDNQTSDKRPRALSAGSKIRKGGGGRSLISATESDSTRIPIPSAASRTVGKGQGRASSPAKTVITINSNVSDITDRTAGAHSVISAATDVRSVRSAYNNTVNEPTYQPSAQVANTPAGRNQAVTFDIPSDKPVKKRAQSAGRPNRPTSATTVNAAGPGSAQQAAYSKFSNHQQIRNALNNVCLAGSHQDATRKEALDAIDAAIRGEGYQLQDGGDDQLSHIVSIAVQQFLVLFYHSKSLSFRGIYGVIPNQGLVVRLFGRGPKHLREDQIEGYFKYESSSRSFKPLPVKSLTSTADAVSIDPSKLKKQ